MLHSTSKAVKLLIILYVLVTACSCRTSNSYIHNSKIPTEKQYNVVAYVSGWSNLPVSNINVQKLTHINYAFANLDKQGRVFFTNSSDSLKIDTLRQLKKYNPNLKIIVSIGGWTYSKNFSDIAANTTLSNKCAQNIADFVFRHQLDGIDIDWEYPCMKGAGNSFQPNDKQNFTSFIRNIRHALTAVEVSQKRDKPYILSIATATSSNYLNSIESLKLIEYVDFMHIMTYDYRSGSNWETGHHSNLWVSLSDWSNGNCIDQTIKKYLNEGIPADKLIMGVPFYGRRWKGVTKSNNGLYQPAQTSGQSIAYRTILKECTPQKGYVNFWDDSAQAPYLWNKHEGVFISYENQQSLRYKIDYMKQHDLNGVMFWEYNCDNNNELFNATLNYIETDRYAYKKQRDKTLASTPYLVNIYHILLISQFLGFEDEYGASLGATPRPVLASGAMSNKTLAPFISSLWLNQFLSYTLPLYFTEFI